MQRRAFLSTLAATALGHAAPSASPAPIRLGVDLFSLRSQGWSAYEYLDYCSKFGVKVVHFSEIRFIGSLEPAHVKQVHEHAKKLGIDMEIGIRSICPTSKMFDPKQGTAEEQLLKAATAAKTAGSQIMRCVLGGMDDRKTPGGIEARIEDTVKVLRACKSRLVDMNIKVAIENHAGDMQGREVKALIETAGKDFVGSCFDSGNPLWTLEDPHVTFETLQPYVLTSHIRDSYLWDTENGTAVRWVRMGEGNVDIAGLIKKYQERCPGRAMSLEVIVTGARPFDWRKPEFWSGYENVPAWSFARFAAISSRGQAQPPQPPVSKEQIAQRERDDFEASMKWTRAQLGL